MKRLQTSQREGWSYSVTKGMKAIPLLQPFRIWTTSVHHIYFIIRTPVSLKPQCRHFAMAATPPIPENWQLVAWQKRDERDARIPPEWRLKSAPSPDSTTLLDIPRKSGLLSAEELRITEKYDATALADAIRKRELKCVDVTRAFCKVRNSAR